MLEFDQYTEKGTNAQSATCKLSNSAIDIYFPTKLVGSNSILHQPFVNVMNIGFCYCQNGWKHGGSNQNSSVADTAEQLNLW